MSNNASRQQNQEKQWARAFAVFKKITMDGGEHVEAHIAEANLNAAEREILDRLLAAQEQHTEVLDDAFLQRQQQMEKAMLKNREGEQLGQYHLLKLIGSGGMSAVYLAKRSDADIQKKVAVKILLFPSICPHVLELFLQEQRLLSRLNHPNIVSMLHGAMDADGTPFLVMEYIPDARTIDQWVEDKQATTEDIVHSLLPLCDAIAHAHSHLIVHSDIKPGNVLVDPNGTVKLLDFGIASFLRKQQQDQSGVRALSPAYASPEQLAGESLTIASDIYSTGLLLSHLLTGEAPAPASLTEASHSQKRQALKQQLNHSRVDTDLQKIILKATEEKPGDRYQSIQEMRQDLRRWLKKEPIAAHPGGWFYRAKKFVQRRTALSLAITGLAIALIAGVILLEAENRKTRLEAEKARQVTRFMLDAFAISDPDMAKGIDFTARDILTTAKHKLDGQSFSNPAVRDTLQAAIAAAENRLGNFAEAYATAQPLLAQKEPLSRAVEAATESLVQMGQVKKAADLLNRLGHRMKGTVHAYWQARLAASQDRFDEAKQWLAKADTLAETKNDPVFAIKRQRLRGDILFKQGKNDQAMRIFQQALTSAKETLGAQHSQTLGLQQHIATIYNDRGEFDRAFPELEKLLSAQEQHFSRNHPVLILTLLQLAGNRQYKQDFAAAQTYAQRALQIATETVGENSLLAGRSHNLLGILAYRQGKIAPAIAHLQKASQIYHQHLGRSHRESGEIDTTLANLLIASGQPEKAEELLMPVAEAQQEKLGADHKASIYSQLTLIKALNAQQKYRQALQQATETLPLAIKGVGEKHPMTVALRKGQADAFFGLGQYAQAIEGYEKVLHSDFMQQQTQQQPALLNQLAKSQWLDGQRDKARQTFAEAKQKAAAVFGHESPAYQRILDEQNKFLKTAATLR